MNFDEMYIPHFKSTSTIDTLQAGMVFVGVGITFGIVTTLINRQIVKNKIDVLNFRLEQHFISEVKRMNQ